MIFTKVDASNSGAHVEKLTRELNIHYRSSIGSLIYLLSTRICLSFAIHKLVKFPSKFIKIHFEGFICLLRYIRGNKTLVIKYYTDAKDTTLSDLFRKTNITPIKSYLPSLIPVGNIVQTTAEV